MINSYAVTLGATTLPASQRSILSALDRSSDNVLILRWSAGTVAVPLCAGETVSIGRDAEATVAIDEATLSRKHAAVQMVGDEVWLEDLRSSNGTFLDGRQVSQAKLTHDSWVQLGKAVTLRLHRAQSPLPDEGLDFRSFEEELARLLQGAEGPETIRVSAVRASEAQLASILSALPDTEGNVLSFLWCWYRPGMALLAGDAGIFPPLEETVTEIGTRTCPPVEASASRLIAAAVSQLSGRRVPSARPPLISGRKTAPLVQEILRVAPSRVGVLLLGETGSGKEVFARELHQHSDCRSGPFVTVNCGALSPSLVEATFFGHEAGAFTGATHRRAGLFEQADGGTLFLDEVGELPPSAQASLLRVLETQTLRRVGGHEELAVSVRVVSATHRDLGAMCAAGEFREDLWYRLNAVKLAIPPLRDRLDEIPELATHFVRAANELHGTRMQGLTEDALDALRMYDWPGNLRELRNVIERAVVLGNDALITAHDLPREILGAWRRSDHALPTTLKQQLIAFESDLIVRALLASGGNQTQAAYLLSLPRRTFIYKINQYSLAPRIKRELAMPTCKPLEAAEGFRTLVDAEEERIISAAVASEGSAARAARRLGVSRNRVSKTMAKRQK